MPEGHTIHRIARDHAKRYVGENLSVSSPQGRFATGARQLDGRQLTSIEAHGKHLFYWWEEGLIVHVHLGLYGKFRNHASPPPAPRGAVRMRVIGGEHAFDLNGPAACDLVDARYRDLTVDRLGQDPLRADADPELVWQRIHRSRAAIGSLLLDQSVIAGVGNVFRADVLFALKIHPNRPGASLERGEFDDLWSTLVKLLRIGVKYNRIITADADDWGKTPGRLNREERLLIYKKPSCPDCGQPVDQWQLRNRTIYACGRCQQ